MDNKDATELLKLVEGRDYILARIESDRELVKNLNSQIKAACFHPMTVKKSTYYPGGYDYESESKNWDECTICGEKFNLVEKYGGEIVKREEK